MKKCILLLLLSLPLLSSCGLLRKTRTIVRTETITHVDTLVQVRVDTVRQYNMVYLHDTAFLDNPYSEARSYYDTSLRKIVLSLQQKQFDVKVTFTKKVQTEIKTKETKIPFQWYVIPVLIIILIILIKKYLL